jgi:rare lipoprotein A
MRRLIAALIFCLLAFQFVPKSVSHLYTRWVDSSQRGTKTASGIPLNDNAMTAHKSLSFGSTVKVTNKKNGHAVTVTITDRGAVR